MSATKWVDCPNGGRCGTPRHDPSKAQYRKCAQVGVALKSAAVTADGPPPAAGPALWEQLQATKPQTAFMCMAIKDAPVEALDRLDRVGHKIHSHRWLHQFQDAAISRTREAIQAVGDGAWEEYMFAVDVQDDASRAHKDRDFSHEYGILMANNALMAVYARQVGADISDDDYEVLTSVWESAGMELPEHQHAR